MSDGLGGVSTGAERLRNTSQMPVHRTKDTGKPSKKVRQKGLNMSVGDEDRKGDQLEMRHFERRADSKYGASGNMAGKSEGRNAFCRNTGYEVMAEPPSRDVLKK